MSGVEQLISKEAGFHTDIWDCQRRWTAITAMVSGLFSYKLEFWNHQILGRVWEVLAPWITGFVDFVHRPEL
jgi:hypothetical protein